MNYTFVDMVGDRIFHSYIDDDDNKKYEVIRSFPIQLYVQGKKRADSSIGLMGQTLNPIDFSNIRDAKEFIREYSELQELHGQTSIPHQFISHYYPNDITFDIRNITILNFDIETAFDETGFPTPDKANQEIISISAKRFGDERKMVVFALPTSDEYSFDDSIIFVSCSSEKELLRKFQEYWIQVAPDILTGWNIDGFDVPYLINRCKKLFDADFVNHFSPFHRQTPKCVSEIDRGFNGKSYRILGITVFDYLDLYKKYAFSTLESYALNVVGNFELGVGKIDYSEYGNLMDLYQKNFQLFVDYNIRDVRLIEDIDKKRNFIFLALTIAYLGKVRFNEIFGQVRFWDVHIYNSLKKKGIQIPPEKRKKEHDDIVGAFVKNPIPDLYSWIVTVDLTSLYPSIMMSFNLSPETKVEKAKYTIDSIEQFIDMEIDTRRAHQYNWSMLGNGACFDNSRKGIFVELVEEMFAERKRNKKLAIDLSIEIEQLQDSNADPKIIQQKRLEQSTFDSKQMAYKIALNSLYGASANQYFRYNDRDIAEGITITGQLIIRYISKRLNVKLNKMFKTQDVDYVVFNDTDSAGLNLGLLVDKMFGEDQSDKQKIVNFLDKFEQKYIDPYMEEEFARLVEYLNCFQNRISMKREVIADKGLWRGKKHYILQVYDKEGVRYHTPKLKMMGIETAKSSTPQIVRGSLEKAIRIILNEDEEKLQQFAGEFKEQFFTAKPSEIAFPRGVSDVDKWLDSRMEPKKACPIHVRAAIYYNRLVRQKKIGATHPFIKNGDKIKFMYLKKQNPHQMTVIGFLDELPKEFELDEYIDRDKQYEKTFFEPLKSFTDIVGWNPERIATLDDFFV